MMMKSTKSSGLRYSEAFKQHAIELLLTGSMSMNQLAKELGITLDSLRTWKAKYLQRAGSVQRDGQKGSKIADFTGDSSGFFSLSKTIFPL